METKPKNRAWVKDAAIVFLVVLLILTFFSNTIMNHSLPEVATQMVTDGTITAKVRGTGTVEALGDHKVKAKSNLNIAKVMVKAGQEVNAGDVLFVLGAADDAELDAAIKELEDLQTQYQQSALNVPIVDQFLSERNEIKKKQDTVTAKKRTLDEMARELQVGTTDDGIRASQEIIDLYARRDTVLAKITAVENDRYIILSVADYETKIEKVKNDITAKQAELDTLKLNPDATPEQIQQLEEIISMLQQDEARLNSELANVQNKIAGLPYHDEAALNIEKARLTTELGEIETKLRGLEAGGVDLTKAKAYMAAYDEYRYSIDAVNEAQDSLNKQVEQQNRSLGAAGVGLSAISKQIERQQEKIKKLSGEGEENTITANVAGTVTEVNYTAGDTVVKDDILCSIEVPDMGYTVSFSVTNDQARRLHVGDTATISNFYWGNQIVATLASIQTDKKNPTTNKTLTFNLEGDVNSGAELTVSVGQKSARYDTIIPNSAIRTDSNGSFVLAVTEKSSPLGNRYIAKRVNIEVQAADDTTSAVTADLNYGDYVITTASAPVASGDMVRLTTES